MEALRTIVDSEQLASIIDLPVGLRNREVEVIVLSSNSAQRKETPPSKVIFTDEQREQFRQRRESCVAEFESRQQNKPRMTNEEFHKYCYSVPLLTKKRFNFKMKSEKI